VRVFLILLFLGTTLWADDQRRLELSILVTDDSGIPLADAEVRVEYQGLSKSGEKMRDYTFMGTTDSTGRCLFDANTTESITISASNKGYHKSKGIMLDLLPSQTNHQNWYLDSQKATISLIKEIDPVDMLHKKVVWKILKTSGDGVGFDFQKGDWVAPHGMGVFSDIVFTSQGEFVNHREHSIVCNMTFSDTNGGIQEEKNLRSKSSFSHKATAPSHGYENRVAIVIGKQKNYEAVCYFYSRGLHGKFVGPIELIPENKDKSAISFEYFLNPAGTSNMEVGTRLEFSN